MIFDSTNPKVLAKLNAFFSQHLPQHFHQGHIIISANTIPAGVFFLVKGVVKQYVLSGNGHELVVNLCKPGSFFPITWAATSQTNSFFFEALEEVTVYRAPQASVIDFIQQEPEVLFDVFQRISSGIDGLLQHVSYIATGSTRQKVISTLIMLAKRFGKSEQGQSQTSISLSLTHKEIATLSGTTRETVTRVLQQLKKEKFVSVRKKMITLPSLEKMEKELLVDLSFPPESATIKA